MCDSPSGRLPPASVEVSVLELFHLSNLAACRSSSQEFASAHHHWLELAFTFEFSGLTLAVVVTLGLVGLTRLSTFLQGARSLRSCQSVEHVNSSARLSCRCVSASPHASSAATSSRSRSRPAHKPCRVFPHGRSNLHCIHRDEVSTFLASPSPLPSTLPFLSPSPLLFCSPSNQLAPAKNATVLAATATAAAVEQEVTRAVSIGER